MAKKHRGWAFVMACAAKKNKLPWQSAKIKLEFTFPDKRKRDIDGMISSTKNFIDGIADARVVENDHMIREFEVVILPPNKNKTGLRITISEKNGQ